MQRKHAPSNNKRKATDAPLRTPSQEKGKEKETEFDIACNMALDEYNEQVAALQTDEVMSEGPESEGESDEFVPETP